MAMLSIFTYLKSISELDQRSSAHSQMPTSQTLCTAVISLNYKEQVPSEFCQAASMEFWRHQSNETCCTMTVLKDENPIEPSKVATYANPTQSASVCACQPLAVAMAY